MFAATVMPISYADLATGRRVTPDTPFNIGSNSKQFTAVAILMLAEAGKLSHSDEITLGELLTHTSGYTDFYLLVYLTPQFFAPVDPKDKQMFEDGVLVHRRPMR